MEAVAGAVPVTRHQTGIEGGNHVTKLLIPQQNQRTIKKQTNKQDESSIYIHISYGGHSTDPVS